MSLKSSHGIHVDSKFGFHLAALCANIPQHLYDRSHTYTHTKLCQKNTKNIYAFVNIPLYVKPIEIDVKLLLIKFICIVH